MSFKRIAAAATLLFAAQLLAGAGPYTNRISPQDLKRIHTVAIISALGDSFLFERVTDSRFQWLGPPDSHFLEISDWALDPQITKEVTKELAKRFAVMPIEFVPADFSTWDYSGLKQSALNLNGDPAIDAYVFVLRDWRSDEIGWSVHPLGGLGLYRRDTKMGVFSSYRIVVVDALTGDAIASRAALMRDGQLPWTKVDASLWPKTQNDMGDAQRQILIADETKLIEDTLARTLQEMNLAR